MYIYTHQGLGDHIICNGLIRSYAIKEEVSIFCKKNKYENVSFMYRDNKNIKIIKLNSDQEIRNYITNNKLQCKLIGHTKQYFEQLKNEKTKLGFDELFYHMCNIDFETRFTNFYVKRDIQEEDSIYNLTNPFNKKYIYIHDDHKLNFVIDSKKHRQDLKIIRNQPQVNIFNMRKILENAAEIHTMQTGMFDFCNSIKLNCPIFLHTYVRNYPNEKWISKSLNDVRIVA